jgi:hypothetical protein
MEHNTKPDHERIKKLLLEAIEDACNKAELQATTPTYIDKIADAVATYCSLP